MTTIDLSNKEKPIESTETTSLPECEASPNPQPEVSPKNLQRKQMVMKPLPGNVWNPLKTYPRNKPCPCLSGKKFKTCCLERLAPVVTKELASQYKEQMSKPDLVFLTKSNEALIKERIAPHVKAELEQKQLEEQAYIERIKQNAIKQSERSPN